MNKNLIASAYIVLITFVFGTILYIFPEHEETAVKIEQNGSKGVLQEGQDKLDISAAGKTTSKGVLCGRKYDADIQAC